MKPKSTLALVVLAASLGGCQNFVQAFDFSRQSSAPQYAIGPADLKEGREHLRAGRTGNALSPLHRAALNPQTSGDALNALGVAYAKLGRADLAERYFIAATRVDADDERFAANLDRFYRSDLARDSRLLYAQRERTREALAELAQNDPIEPAEPVTEERMVMSGGEIHRITISNAARSQRISVGGSASMAQTQMANSAPARVRLSSGELRQPAGAARPAELVLRTANDAAPSRVRIGQSQAANSYPLRVRLAPRPAAPDKN
jgi:tetratricopeptide (TPR) repeat protein